MAQQPPPGDNLYVADLPGGIDDSTLKTIFSAYGAIQSHKILTNPTPGSKCAAMIRFSTVEEASWIVENLNGNIPQGLTEPVKVRFAFSPQQKNEYQAGKSGAQKGAAGWPEGGAKGGSLQDGGAKGGGWQNGGANGGWQSGGSWGGKDGGGWKGGGGAGKDAGWQPGGKGGGWQGGGKAAEGKNSWSEPYPTKGKDGKANGKGKGKECSIRILHNGLIEAQALPGCDTMSNDFNALFISGLPSDSTDVDLYKIFSPFGAIPPKGVRAMMHPDGTCKGFGFVNYLDPKCMEVAMTTLNGTQMPDGSVLTIKPKDAKAASQN
eukprot:TRINITY_DN9934_c0_g1_i1.p1 TRINITY_DN9934_c0_g1~~TRINITY_DN9934_c0_g1_i1.p1  ORF type:complete len:321 (-),score=59.48 TRINITY_DN9934_c0_g1_i1:312-1274(-)